MVATSSDGVRPTSDPHDYVSIGTYWWPNPKTADGLPFVRRDGETSPVLDRYDRLKWDLHCDGLSTFAAAQRLGEDYQSAIDSWVNAWYIDPATRMNPHLRHAQFCPGHDAGRMVGCIDFTVRLPRFVECLRRCLPISTVATTPLAEGTKGWWQDFFDWLIRPEVRRWHAAANNNLGIYYDRSVIYLALWLGHDALAENSLRGVLTERVGRQIQADSRLPHELGRTRSYDYTLMTDSGFVDLAVLGDSCGINLFEESLPDSGSIASSVDWVWKQAASQAPWPEKQIARIDWANLLRLWWCLPIVYRDRDPLAAIAHRLDESLRAEPERECLTISLHQFHQPVWSSFPHLVPSSGH